MTATIRRDCPRCADPILPGQEMTPMPRGWTHAACVEPCCKRHEGEGL